MKTDTGAMVITTNNAVSREGLIRTGRVVGPADTLPDRYWLELNILGQHLGQMYEVNEFELATVDLAHQHGLCRECLGYGEVKDAEQSIATRTPRQVGQQEVFEQTTWVICPDCKGSGAAKYQTKHVDADAATVTPK